MTAFATTVGGKRLKLTNLDKLLYPDAGFTKSGVIDYYTRIAPAMLKHLASRPVSLKRYPNGVNEKFFFQKNAPDHRPPWVKTVAVHSEVRGEDIDYIIVSTRATLVWLANLAALEIHTYLGKSPNLMRPTVMVFDMDPGAPAGLLEAMQIAVMFRDFLSHAGLDSYAKTSGGKGVHVYVPLNSAVTYDQTKRFAREVALVLEQKYRGRITSNMRKDLRTGKVFIDWSQNDDHKTTACAYTLRAHARPTVSTPVTWDEIEEAIKRRKPESLVFEAPAVLERVDRLGDLFEPVLTQRQRLPSV
ncbi:MAG: ATP-dependent DNA ligase [Phycisphaerales bacterium]|nr:ATP-dependent DNA ligase [Phycisphaerales bacterium]